MNRYYRAPWGKEVRTTTALLLTLLIVSMVVAQGIGLFFLVATIIASYLFYIRGYSLQNGKLVIHGLLWSRTYNLTELHDAQAHPYVLTEARRQGLPGGLFSHMGYYCSPTRGRILSLATHAANTVLLDFSGKQIVISPEDPEAFENDVLLEYRRIRRM